MKAETVFTQAELDEFRTKLRGCGYEMTGEIGNLETWTPPTEKLVAEGGHVFYVSVRNVVTYVTSTLVTRELPFSRAMGLVGKAPPE
jgi:hypothetical protein